MYDLTKNEELILISIWKLRDQAYGISIKEDFRKITGKALNYGSMYNTLFQLLKKGYIASRESLPLSKRGGRRKVLYSLTAEGEKALSHARKIQRLAWENVTDFSFEEKK
jgi:DNA-binding PadR family transcriptional regulator